MTATQRVDQPLVGYRCWTADRFSESPRLLAVAWELAWKPVGTNEARCQLEVDVSGHRTHPAPSPTCSCGFHAYDSLATALAYVARLRRDIRPDALVVGAALLWGGPGRPVMVGRVPDALGAAGLRYRAPFARVLALSDAAEGGKRARDLGERLGIQVVPDGWLEAYAREHGEQLPVAAGGPRRRAERHWLEVLRQVGFDPPEVR